VETGLEIAKGEHGRDARVTTELGWDAPATTEHVDDGSIGVVLGPACIARRDVLHFIRING
jgi:hypothetical protein